ncbi:flagellar hook-length control protein FliK [Sulfitobacter sp. MF3-043]|uniref:flagellar hook-length control protein FliK n=1 Tax=Sulfitobacter sediminivivens TaxID=3252902 RepID=UPI0036DB2F96
MTKSEKNSRRSTMHPLLSQLPSQSAPAGNPSTGGSEQVPPQQYTNEDLAGRGGDTFASFQKIFEIENDAKSIDTQVIVPPADPAKKTDQPADITDDSADERDMDGSNTLAKRTSLADGLSVQDSVQLASDPAISAAISGHRKQQPLENGDLAKAIQSTAASKSGDSHAVPPTKILSNPDHFNGPVASKTQAQVSHNFSLNTQASSTVAHEGKIHAHPNAAHPFEARADQKATVDSQNIERMIVPMSGKNLEKAASTSPGKSTIQQPQTGEPKAFEVFRAGSSAQADALIRASGMDHRGQMPIPERFDLTMRPTLDRATSPSTRPMPTGLIQSMSWNAEARQAAPNQTLLSKTLVTEPFSLLPPEISHAPTTQHGSVPLRPEMPAYIARQLAEVAQHLPARPVDITLSPEELGRVRLSVVPSEHGLVVNVLAERPETLDLLRRHIDQLAQEFQKLGYEDIGFSFSGAEQNTSDEQADHSTDQRGQAVPPDPDHEDIENTRIHLSSEVLTGLDLRL